MASSVIRPSTVEEIAEEWQKWYEGTTPPYQHELKAKFSDLSHAQILSLAGYIAGKGLYGPPR